MNDPYFRVVAFPLNTKKNLLRWAVASYEIDMNSLLWRWYHATFQLCMPPNPISILILSVINWSFIIDFTWWFGFEQIPYFFLLFFSLHFFCTVSTYRIYILFVLGLFYLVQQLLLLLICNKIYDRAWARVQA